MARETRDDEVQQAGAPSNRAMRRLQKREEARQRGATRERRRPPTPPTARDRTSPAQFGREVRAELRKVAWPSRSEVVNSTIVVLIAVTVLVALIFGFDWAFGEFVLYLFE